MVKKGVEKKSEVVSEKTFNHNYWMYASVVLALILVVMLAINIFSGVSPKKAGELLTSFADSQGVPLQVSQVKTVGDLYQVDVNIEGQVASFYVTKDGKYFIQSVIPLDDSVASPSTNTPTPAQNVPKSDKPKVELFVMSHCPYGTQAEKGIIPVVGLLKDKIDFELKFVYYAMHPSAGEVEEQTNQYCIQKEQQDKFLPYLICFLEDGNSERCLTEAKIDKTKMNSCYAAADKQYDITKNLNDRTTWLSGQFPMFNIHKADNDKYSVAGSPTLIINGVEVSSGRDSVSLLGTICNAFNEQPEECSKVSELKSTTPGPGFGWDAAGTANLAACGF